MPPPGWAKIENDAIDRVLPLGPTAAGVYLALLWHADHDTRDCYPSVGRLAKLVGVSPRTVRRTIRALEVAGVVVTRERFKETGSTLPHTYYLPLLAPQEPADTRDGGGLPCPGPLSVVSGGGGHQGPTNQSNRTRVKKPGSRKQKTIFDPLTLRLPFDSERFRQSWSDFCQSRSESKHPLTELAASKLLTRCERFGEAVAVEAIDTAIENGWRGIFLPKGNGQPKPAPEPLVYRA